MRLLKQLQRILTTLMLMACLLSITAAAIADTHHFNGDGDGTSWSDPDNWLEDAVPATTSDGESADDVEIDGLYTVYIDSTIQSIHNLYIDGGAYVVVESGYTLNLQTLEVIDGGLELENISGTGANINWPKTNRGHLYVESAGYICGTGTITTRCNGYGVRLMSTQSSDFDMTDITLKLDYGEPLWVCSADNGRDELSDWTNNFAIGTLILDDYRYYVDLYEADGTTGGDTNALYCYELVFSGSWDDTDGAKLDLQGTNVYVRDEVTWFDSTYSDTAGQLTVATAYDNQDVTTSLVDDDTTQGEAYIGVPPNTAPVVDAGSGSTIMIPSYAVLDATVSDDGLPSATLTYTWSMYSGPGTVTFDDASACDTTATFSVDGTYVLQLSVSDGALSSNDTVTIIAQAHVQGLHHFNGDGDGTSWNDPDNWLENAVPTTTSTGDGADTVEIDGTYNVVVTEDVISVGAVTIDGGATLTIDPAITLTVQGMNIINGGLILDSDASDTSTLDWGKANRGSLQVQSNGYIAGEGTIRTTASSTGVQLMSTQSANFDMTAITLQIAYQEQLRVCSVDMGGTSLSEWSASNYTIGKLYFSDRRYAHTVSQSDGTAGDGTNAVYCLELQFGGDADETAQIDLNSLNLYVRDQVSWGNGTYDDTDGELTVASSFSTPVTDFTTAIWDDNATQGKAYLGAVVNIAPVVDAGADDMIAVVQAAILDGTVTDDGLPSSSLTYSWTTVSGPGTVTFADSAAVDTTATFSTDGTYVLQLNADDGDLDTSDTVTITVTTYTTGTHYWSGDGDGSSWSDADNWYEDEVPLTTSDGESADPVIIQGNVQVNITSDVDAIKSLTIDGGATVVVESGILLSLQSINIISGGLELEEVSDIGADIEWSKANRGSLLVQSDGYIAGTGTIWTMCGGSGVQLMSTRATDFDMTDITLRLGYGDSLRVCSSDDGRATIADWEDNFAIGKLYMSDRRYDIPVSQADGTAGDGTNAVYCYEIQFGGDADETAQIDLNSLNLYVRDQVTWGDGTYDDTAGALTVASSYSTPVTDFTTAIWDDNTTQGAAYIGSASSNSPPIANAGNDQTVTDSDDSGSESVTLDGTSSSDSDGTITSYVWTEGGSQIATGSNPSVTLTVGTHNITLTVTDDDSATDTDTVTVTVNSPASVGLLDLLNRQSGISLTLSGTNGTDWAVEHLYHDMAIGDQLIYLKSDVDISLAHNANNTIIKTDSLAYASWTADGPDGTANTGDEGDIHYKIDRDMQSHRYNGGTSVIPSYCPLYSSSFDFDSLTYDGTLDVLGTTGDNNGSYGTTPRGTTDIFAYGQEDAFGNEWHTITYWDDDEAVYTSMSESSHRQGASDGHWVYVCVNPVTPIIQFSAPTGEEYYTTPLKTYHIPKTWDQTTYLTDGVLISFVNITDSNSVYYRIDGGTWTEYTGALTADNIFSTDDTEITLEYRCGTSTNVAERTIVMNPSTPASGETHGMMLWADATEKSECLTKLGTQPFAYSYSTLCGSYYQNLTTVYTDARGGWRSGANMASNALSNAFPCVIDGISTRLSNAQMAKERLLRLARLEAVGFENGVSSATPAKDYMNELGQTMQQFADGGLAYDFLASCFRVGDHTDGMTPIEELKIRDGLAEIAKNLIQFRDNWSFVPGSGDTHWAHGYELAVGTIALAMPTYSTPYFGVSGGDMTSTNTYSDTNGEYWNPFPDLDATWYQCVADPEIDCDGYPNNRAPMRSEFQITEDGFWSGPNYLVGDGNRYYTGPSGSRLVDIKSGGLANAENRVELIEMGGYESPFTGRIFALTLMRKLAGDDDQQQCVKNYIRRRVLHGYIPLSWDSTNLKYTAGDVRIDGSLIAFNNNFDFAGETSAVNKVSEYLTYVNRYYGYETGTYPDHIADSRKTLFGVYTLACCADPDDIDTPTGDANHAPIIKPMFKYVVEPGDTIEKYIIAQDLDDDSLTLSVSNLPTGASYNSSTRIISWTPTTSDYGVHVVSVTASDGTASTTRDFPMIVMASPGDGPVPGAPTSVSASLTNDDVSLSWTAPSGVTVDEYFIYRDGNLLDIVDSTQTSYADNDLPAGSHTRYYVSAVEPDGDESSAAEASSYISVPLD